jgi:sugar lactone lactonase YvrE
MKKLSIQKKLGFAALGSMARRHRAHRSLPALTAAIASILIFGMSCATKPVAKISHTFFPPAPDEPRVQFLAAFSADSELGWNSSKFAEFVTGRAAPKNLLLKPYGIAVKDSKIFVCDTMQNAVEVFDFEQKRAYYLAPRGEGKLQMPINISIDVDGTGYVADSERGQVLLYRNDEEYIAAIGRKDEMRPSDVAITTNRLYITDLKGHVVRVYSKADRKLLFTIPRDPKSAERKLLAPTNLAVDEQGGRLIVSDTGAFAVHVYDLEGKLLRTIGEQGVAPGLFARPKGIAIDRSGLIYVVDAATQVVQIFDTEGKLLMFFGQPDTAVRGDLHLPAAVKLDYHNVKLFQTEVAPGYECEYLILVTSQVGGNKVNVYGFLKKK